LGTGGKAFVWLGVFKLVWRVSMSLIVIDGGRSDAPLVQDNTSHETLAQTDVLTLVPEGWYLLTYVGHEPILSWGKPKVAIQLKITNRDKYNGVIVRAYYPVLELEEGPRPGGTFKCGGQQYLFRDACDVLDSRLRPDRIPLSKFAGRELKGEVVTVTKDGDGLEIPEGARYSKVKRIRHA